MTIKSPFAILLASILFTHCGVVAGNIQSLQWEYQVLSLDDLTRIAAKDGALSDSPNPTLESLPILLNLQGKIGWELCGIISDSLVFKRILSDEKTALENAKPPVDSRVSKSENLVQTAFGDRFSEMPEGVFTTIVEQVAIGDEEIIYLQVKSPKFSTAVKNLDEADRLNGISWKASVNLTFSAHREASYPANDSLEWSEWRTTVADDGMWAHVVEIDGELKINSMGMRLFTNSPYIDTAIKPEIASKWKTTVAEEDWGNIFYASQSNDAGQSIRIFSSQEEFKPALLLSPYSDAYGSEFSIRIGLDGGLSFLLTGVRSDYFGEIFAEGIGEKEIEAICNSKTLEVTIADVDKFSFSLDGASDALKSIMDLRKNSSPLNSPLTSPAVP